MEPGVGETKTTDSKPDARNESKPDAKPETKATDIKPEAKDEQKPDAKTEPKPQAQAEVEAKPAVEPKPEAKTTSDLTPQIATRAYEIYEEHGRRDGLSVQNWNKAEQEIREVDGKAEPEAKAEAKPEVKAAIDLTPQLVKPVHQLYEQLGREEVHAVEELEKAKRERSKDEPDK